MWQLTNITVSYNSVTDFIYALLCLNDDIMSGRALCILWSIWLHRNLFVWKQICVPTAHILRVADSFLEGGEAGFDTIQVLGSAAPTALLSWSKPPMGILKCNVNAAIFGDQNATGWSAVVRDSEGSFVRAVTGYVCLEFPEWLKSLLFVKLYSGFC